MIALVDQQVGIVLSAFGSLWVSQRTEGTTRMKAASRWRKMRIRDFAA